MYKALIIGVNEYRDPNIRPLPNTLKDAERINNILTTQPTLFDPSEVQFFSGNQVRTSTLRAVARDFFIKTSSDDIIFFFWAGHGSLIENEGYFITFDTQAIDIPNTAISMSEIRALLDNCNARAVFAWLDCCHSGAFARSLNDFSDWIARGLEVSGSGKII